MSVLYDLVDNLERSIYSPLLVADPAFIKVKSDFENILQFNSAVEGVDLETATGAEQNYILLLAKKEVYMRLAVSVSPEFNIEAEFTRLLKSDRFNHYMKLVSVVDVEIQKAGEAFSIKVGEVLIDKLNGTKRNYELALEQVIVPTFVVTADHIDISWNKFDLEKSAFAYYEILYGTESFYDEFEDEKIDNSKVISQFVTPDIFSTKKRIKNLVSKTSYYILIGFVGRNGKKTYHYSTQTTL